MSAIEMIAGLIVLATLILFVPYWFSVWRLPSGRRPRTPEYDRLGQRIGVEENPDYLETEPDDERAKDATEEHEIGR